MTGTELLGLQHPGIHGDARHRGAHLLAAVTVDHVDRGGVEQSGGVDDVPQQRPARKGLHDLGQVGPHALALARGQDDDGKLHREAAPFSP